MPQSLSFLLVHIVFSTKDRAPVLDGTVRPALHAYLATVARGADCECFRVGGVADHVHLVVRLSVSKLATEKELEDMIMARPEMISPGGMLIGRQVRTSFGGIIGLLAIAPDGSLVLIELKRGEAPREIAAQALGDASWLEKLKPDKIARIYDGFRNGQSLSADFESRFKVKLDEETMNATHQIIIVAAGLDDATERSLGYQRKGSLGRHLVFRHLGAGFPADRWASSAA